MQHFLVPTVSQKGLVLTTGGDWDKYSYRQRFLIVSKFAPAEKLAAFVYGLPTEMGTKLSLLPKIVH